jgi:hypothetical protein
VHRQPSLRPIVIALAVLALVAGACSQDEDVTRAQFAEGLRERTEAPDGDDADDEDDPTITEDEADCIAAAVFERYEQPEINRIYTAATEDELTNERRDELLEIVAGCGVEPPAPAPTDTESTTTTTEAE